MKRTRQGKKGEGRTEKLASNSPSPRRVSLSRSQSAAMDISGKIPSQMLAVVLTQRGKLELITVPVPEPKSDEALVQIFAAALNRRDYFITQNLYPLIEVLPQGSDRIESIRILSFVRDLFAVGGKNFWIRRLWSSCESGIYENTHMAGKRGTPHLRL